jgi:serine protease Do
MARCKSFLAILALGLLATSLSAQENLNKLLQNMTKEAARTAAPTVVQIETRGGADMVVAGPKGQTVRKAIGPTTGVIVSEDGYIISSAFNFINNPNTILVHIPGKGEPLVAQRIATDKSRLLTLIKVDAKGLPVPKVVAKKDLKEGQWAIALGRALETKINSQPSICVGIVSAVGRVWGKAIQTDAKVSPMNYGGPIVDLQGRVQGIIIPASPKGDDELSGFEWYDSGIGFAIPMEDVMTVLPRLKEGKDLQKGLLGVAMKSPDIYGTLPEIGTIQKGSSAEKAGLKAGDVIVEIDGKPVERMAQVQHVLGVKYEGDRIVAEIKSLELTGKNIVIAHPFLGILPLRDDPKLGVEIRHVFEKSPAEKMGLKPGDRIVKFGVDEKALTEFTGEKRGRNQFFDFLNTMHPGAEIKLAVKKKGNDKADLVTVTLGDLPGSLPGIPAAIPEKLPEIASVKKALDPLELNNPNIKPAKVVEQKDPPKPDTGFLEKNTPDGETKYYVYVDEEYDPNVAHAVLVWLHPLDKNDKEEIEAFVDLWKDYCKSHNLILIMPVEKKGGWLPSSADNVVAAVQDGIKPYTVDRQRIVAHGMSVGGQMALHLGFNNRDLFRGVSAVGASALQIKNNVPNQRLSFFLHAGDLDPIAKSVSDSRLRLAERRYPAFYREMPERGREYLEQKHIPEVVRWIDSLDMQ